MESAGSTRTSSEPLRVLSLDGGGIRGISSLLILERVMEKVADSQHLDHAPRPGHYFDLIGGTSTGGIIAIMLGRLGMTVHECIQAYKQVAEQAFTPKRTSNFPASPTGAFSATALEAAIKQIVREHCTDSECMNRRRQGLTTADTCPHCDLAFRDSACTKTVVLAITKDNVDAPPTLFKTYDTSAAFDTCTLWQVARATSAATTFFKSISVGRDGIEFVDAGFGYNNPCDILIQEAQREFPDRGQMRILSVGTGLGDVVAIKDRRLYIIDALKKMATSSKKVAANLAHRYGDSGEYHRFNVDQGLQDITLSDWKKASKISAHTRNYLAENERLITKCVDDFTGHSQVPKLDKDAAIDCGKSAPNIGPSMAHKAAQLKSNIGGNDGWIPLYKASEIGSIRIVRALIDAGEDVNASADNGRTPLMAASENGHLEVAEALLTAGANCRAIDKDRWTPLHLASSNGHKPIVELLIATDVDVDPINLDIRTPLWYASNHGHEAVVKLLIATGKVNVDIRDRWNETPLWWAARHGHESIVDLLLTTKEVDADARTGNGWDESALFWAARNGHEGICQKLMATGKVEIDMRNGENRTPLWWACFEGHICIVKLQFYALNLRSSSPPPPKSKIYIS